MGVGDVPPSKIPAVPPKPPPLPPKGWSPSLQTKANNVTDVALRHHILSKADKPSICAMVFSSAFHLISGAASLFQQNTSKYAETVQKTPSTTRKMQRQNVLDEAVDTRTVRQMERAQTRAAQRMQSAQQVFPMHSLATSVNPVAKAKQEYFLPRSVIVTTEFKSYRVPSYFRKDDILSNFRLLFIDREQIRQFEVEFQNSSFIDLQVLSDYFTSNKLPPEIMRNVPSFISSYDLYLQSGSNPQVQDKIDHIAAKLSPDFVHRNDPGLAVKTGSENIRELLAGQILGILGINRLLVPKITMENPQATLGSAPLTGAIASRWLADSRPIPEPEWEALMSVQVILRQAMANKFGGDFSDLTKILDFTERVLRAKMLPGVDTDLARIRALDESIQMQAMIDLLLCSNDSHLGQYAVQGEVKCFDFARFLAPSTAFIHGNQTSCVLRSMLLDHPACGRPMSVEMIDKIKQWNPDDVESQLRDAGLIGTDEEFDRIKKQIVEQRKACLKDIKGLNQAIQRAKTTGDDRELQIKLAELYQKHGLTARADINKAILTMINYLLEIQDRDGIQGFGKIDPEAFRQFKARLYALKAYVAITPSPTLIGAFEKMYPDEFIFWKALTKLESDPANALALRFDPKKGIALNSYERILTQAKANISLISAQEIQEMEEALARIKQKAVPSYHLRVAMNQG